LLAIGLAIGLGGAFALGQVLQGVFAGVSGRDPATLAAVPALLVAVRVHRVPDSSATGDAAQPCRCAARRLSLPASAERCSRECNESCGQNPAPADDRPGD
jgi:hypothetical protein